MGRPRDENRFLDLIPDGESKGNINLRKRLGWDREKYDRVRDELVAQALIKLGPGRGGSVQKVGVAGAQALARPKKTAREREYYPNFRNALDKWAKIQGWNDYFVERTADRGRGRKKKGKKTGVWTVPDFVVVGHRKYDYTFGVIRDIETFELKKDLRIEGVFETASHSRFATKSTLAILRSDEIDEEDLARVQSECQRLELGLLLFQEHSSDPEDWKWLVEPLHKEPAPADVEKFVDKIQIPEEKRQRLRTWLK
jgi:hypothetical protein